MKIISYSVFGKEKYYKHGVRRNIPLAKKLFPGWIVRLYAEKDTQDDIIEEFTDIDGVDLVVMTQRFPYDGSHWRMLPMEEGHEAVIVRDVDTMLTERDVALVNDWLSTSYKYSVARDEPGMKAEIMAGIWGGRSAKLNIKDSWDRFYVNKTYTNFNDQAFLSRCIYPYIRDDLLVYSEFNVYEGEKNIRKIPHAIERDENGQYRVIGLRVSSDISSEDDGLNEIPNYNIIRKDESNVEGIKYFNDRYESSHIKILKPRYKYANRVKNEIYWMCAIVLEKGVASTIVRVIKKIMRTLNVRFY